MIAACGLCIAWLASTACIGEQATVDVVTFDVDGTVATDAEVDVLAEATSLDADTLEDVADLADVADVAPGRCEQNVDCFIEAPPVCTTWVCAAQRCETAPLSDTACDDGDACTEGDFCASGQCEGGTRVDCAALAPACWSSEGLACDRRTGCPGVASPEGSACDDGVGPAPFSCEAGWMVPEDACDGSGQCRDKSEEIPPGIHPLAGEWFAVLNSAATNAVDATARMDLALGQDGRVHVTNVASNDATWAATFGDGSFCAELDGRVAMSLGSHAVVAVSDPARAVMVLSDDLDRALGLAVRPGGIPSDVQGDYRAVKVQQYAPEFNSAMTRVGKIPFAAGCIDGQGELTTSAGLGLALDVVATDGSCLTQVGRHMRLTVGLRSSGRTDVFPESWVGVVAAGGDLMVFVREEPGLVFAGLVVLVRERGATTVAQMAGDWRFVQHRGGMSDPNGAAPDVIYETGHVTLGQDFTQLSGTVLTEASGGVVVLGAWWFIDGAGRYSQRAARGGDLSHITGFLAPSDDLIVGWVVDAPQIDPTTPQTLRAQPREGSLFLSVRRRPF